MLAYLGYLGLLDSKLPLYSCLNLVMLYIPHSKIAMELHPKSFIIYPTTYDLVLQSSLHFFIQLSLSILSTCPNHPLVFRFFCLSIPDNNISMHQQTFDPSMSHYTSIVPSCHFSQALPSPLLSLPISHAS